MLKKRSIIFLLLVGFFLGYKIEKHDVYQRLLANLQIKKNKTSKVSEWHDAKLTFSRYSFGVPMYLDHPYSDSIGDKRLEGLNIIKIARHQKADIRIYTKYPISIYRVTNDKNNGLRHDFKNTDIKVNLVGISSIHDKVVKKDFKPGLIVLAAGGPISSSRILFELKGNFKNKMIQIYSDLQPGL